MDIQERRKEIIKRLNSGEELEEIYADYPELSNKDMEADRRFFLRANIITRADIEGKDRQRMRREKVIVSKSTSTAPVSADKKVEESPSTEQEGLTSDEIRTYILEHFTSSTNEQMGIDLGLETHEIAGYRKKLIEEGLMKRHQELLEERREERRKRAQELVGKIKVSCIAARLGINPETVYKILNIGDRRQIQKPKANPEDPTLKMSAEELENAGKRVKALDKMKEYGEAIDVINDILSFGNMPQNKLAILEEIKIAIERKESRRRMELKRAVTRSSKPKSNATTRADSSDGIEWINGEDR